MDFINAYDKIKVDKLKLFLAFIKNKDSFIGQEFRRSMTRIKDKYLLQPNSLTLKAFSNVLKRYSKNQ